MSSRLTSPLALLTSAGPERSAKRRSPDASSDLRAPKRPRPSTSADAVVTWTSAPCGAVTRRRKSARSKIKPSPRRLRGTSTIASWPSPRCRTSIRAPSTRAWTSSFELVASSSTVVSSPSTDSSEISPDGTLRSSVSAPGVWKLSRLISPTSRPAAGARRADRAYRREPRYDRTVLERTSCLLLSGLGVARDPLPRPNRAAAAARHRTLERAHEQRVDRDAFRLRCLLDRDLQRVRQPQGDPGGQAVLGCLRLRLLTFLLHVDQLRVMARQPDVDVAVG